MAKDAEANLIIRIKEFGSDQLKKVTATLDEMKVKAGLVSAAMAGFVGLAVKSFAEAQEASNALNAALKAQGLNVDDIAGKYGKYAAAIQKKTVFGDDEIVQALALAQSMAGNIELTEESIKATVDFAAATGMDLKGAFSVVGKSIGTNSNMLGRYGIELTDSMSKSDKLAAITGQLTQKFNGASDAQAQGLGSLKMMSNEIGDIMEVIGEQFAPAITSAAKLVTKFATALQDPAYAKFIAIAVSVVGGVTGVIAAMGSAVAIMPILTSGVAALGTAFSVLMGPVGLVVAAVTLLGTAWVKDFGHIQEITFGVFGALDTLFKGFVNNTTALFSGFGSLLSSVFTLDMEGIKKSIADIKSTSQTVITDTVQAFKDGYADRSKSLNEAVAADVNTEKTAAAIKAGNEALAHGKAADEKKKIDEKAAEERKKLDEQAIKDAEERQQRINDLEDKLYDDKLKTAREKTKEYLDIQEKIFLESEKEKIKAAEELEKAHQEWVKSINDLTTVALSDGLKGVAGSLVSTLTESFLPGFGGAAGAAFNLLSQDADKFAESMATMFDTGFFDNIMKNIPVLFQTIIDKLPDIIQRLITSIIENSPKIAVALAKAVTDPRFTLAIGLAIFYGVKDGILRALKDLKDNIADIFTVKLPGGGGGGGPKSWFNNGGIVRAMAGGGIVDNQMIMAMAGEAVIPRQTVMDNPQAVGALLSGRSPSGGGSGMVININVNGGLLGNDADARKFAQKIDSELLKLRRDKSSVAFDTGVF